MAQFLYRHASESPQKRPASVSSTDGNDNLLQFSISNNDPFDMCFTHTGSDLVYKATTSTRSCHIVCNSNGRSRDVATIYWQKRDRGTLKVKFQGQSSIYLEDFLRFVQSDGLQHRFTANHEIFDCCYTTDQFVLTDADGTVLANDSRAPAGLFRRRIPSTFNISVAALDVMDHMFVAYICMERARRQSDAGMQGKSYSEAWQTSPGLLCFEGPWAEVM